MAGLKTHTVARGENLTRIAKKYGLSGWKEVYEAKENAKFRKLRPDPNKIEPGDKIAIPVASAKSVQSKYSKNMPRMSISIDAGKKLIFVQQKWQYTYVLGSGVSAWKSKEKIGFHNAVDKVIWSKWSGKYTIVCSGTSDFARACKDTVFNVSFDIKYVTSGGHWKVEVTKIPKGSKKTSKVNWSNQTIKLDTEDANVRERVRGGKTYKQVPAAHEFGHATGSATGAPSGHADEYKTSSPYKDEKKSMLNVGMQLKKRHADHIILELNKMIKDTTFSIKAVK